MMHNDPIPSALATLARLERATNAHDVNEVVACFAADYRNETPTHPERGFTGREQVRVNWEQIFAAVPTITATVLRSAINGNEIWSEWELQGTRQDGSAHLMRGVIIFGLGNELLTWARFFLEPVQEGGGNVDAAVRRQVGAAGPPPPASRTEQR
jgi:ketosteroid isomerase-like protein